MSNFLNKKRKNTAGNQNLPLIGVAAAHQATNAWKKNLSMRGNPGNGEVDFLGEGGKNGRERSYSLEEIDAQRDKIYSFGGYAIFDTGDGLDEDGSLFLRNGHAVHILGESHVYNPFTNGTVWVVEFEDGTTTTAFYDELYYLKNDMKIDHFGKSLVVDMRNIVYELASRIDDMNKKEAREFISDALDDYFNGKKAIVTDAVLKTADFLRSEEFLGHDDLNDFTNSDDGKIVEYSRSEKQISNNKVGNSVRFSNNIPEKSTTQQRRYAGDIKIPEISLGKDANSNISNGAVKRQSGVSPNKVSTTDKTQNNSLNKQNIGKNNQSGTAGVTAKNNGNADGRSVLPNKTSGYSISVGSSRNNDRAKIPGSSSASTINNNHSVMRYGSSNEGNVTTSVLTLSSNTNAETKNSPSQTNKHKSQSSSTPLEKPKG